MIIRCSFIPRVIYSSYSSYHILTRLQVSHCRGFTLHKPLQVTLANELRFSISQRSEKMWDLRSVEDTKQVSSEPMRVDRHCCNKIVAIKNQTQNRSSN